MGPETDYAIGWGTLALINAGIAQGKNRRDLGRDDLVIINNAFHWTQT